MEENRVVLSYDDARDVLYIIEESKGGPWDRGNFLMRLAMRIVRQMPEAEVPEAFGGDWEEDPNRFEE